MNVKFRMPKFGQMQGGKSMLRELLMTTLGTTISIVLTFGTAAWLDQRQQAKNRRQTAMMVLSNIEDFVRNMRYVDSTLVEWDSTLTRIAALPRDSVLRLNNDEANAFFRAIGSGALPTARQDSREHLHQRHQHLARRGQSAIHQQRRRVLCIHQRYREELQDSTRP